MALLLQTDWLSGSLPGDQTALSHCVSIVLSLLPLCLSPTEHFRLDASEDDIQAARVLSLLTT